MPAYLIDPGPSYRRRQTWNGAYGNPRGVGLHTRWLAGHRVNAWLDPYAFTPTGGPTRVGSTVGGLAETFASANFYTATGKSALFSTAPDIFSVAVWCKPAATTRGDMIGRWHTGPANNGGRQFVLLQGTTSSRFAFFVGRSASTTTTGNTDPTNFTVGQWYRVVGVCDGSGNTYLYVNGRLVNTQALGYTTISAALTEECTIGASFDSLYTGDLMDACVWSRALTAAEVWADFDPMTRWDLYAAPASQRWVRPFNPAWASGSNVYLQPGSVA